MSGQQQKVLIIEDEAQIRKFLRISLEAHGYEVLEARIGADGKDLCASRSPDLVILDLGLPDIDGQELIRQLREWTQVPIIVLSVRASESDKVDALDAGANDYVTKPFGIRELMARIRVVMRAAEKLSLVNAVFDSNGLYVDLPRHEVQVDGRPIHLSKKEFELLRTLVTAPGQMLTHQQILREIWGPSHEHETHYLRVLVGQLRGKLHDDPSRPRFIVTVQGVGYRLAVTS